MKTILLGVTGGIAAYKAAILASNLIKLGNEVEVVMTKNSQEFINPIVFETLTNNKVITDMFKLPDNREVNHIEISKKADIAIIAPATYNIIGKAASGIADDMMSTIIAAMDSQKVIFAPAMNENMYLNKIYKDNEKKLKKFGYSFIEPERGKLACQDNGIGRLRNIEEITEIVNYKINLSDKLKGKKVLITAGRTEESIDPIRMITNKSTGKMGYALAEEARNAGAEVLLITGKTNLKIPQGIESIEINNSKEMSNAVLDNYDKMDIIIMSAAVADYRPDKKSKKKIKKSDQNLIINLERTTDILKELGKNIKNNQFLVGFAAESEDLIENSIKKLKSKNLDLIIGNNISAFGNEESEVYLVDKDLNKTKIERMSKKEVSKKIINKIVQLIKRG